MIGAEFVHSSMDHTNLRSITVCDYYLVSFFNKICNGNCSFFNGNLLLWKCGSECAVS